jgi:hypothetical protein
MTEEKKIGSHRKGFLKLKRISPLKMLTFSLFEETFEVFLFPFFCSVSCEHRGFDDI